MLKPNPTLQQLNVLLGEWTIESPQFPGALGSERFEWMEGGAFLVQHSEASKTEFPSGVMVIGRDDSGDTFSVLYYDSRGVSRVYQMQLSNRVWKMWRNTPGFSQRFSGTINKDGNTIAALWEKSTDGEHWEKDFDLIYKRVKGE